MVVVIMFIMLCAIYKNIHFFLITKYKRYIDESMKGTRDFFSTYQRRFISSLIHDTHHRLALSYDFYDDVYDYDF